MRILDWRHLSEPALAEVADDPASRQRLSPSDRHHLDTCDRCRGLIDGHQRAAHLLAAPWAFVTADEVTTSLGVQRVRGVVSMGGVNHPIRLPGAALVALVLLLLSTLIGTGLIAGAIRLSDAPPPAVYAGPSSTVHPSPSPSPSQSPLDTSIWPTFRSARYGLEVSYPSRWIVSPASMWWNLEVDQTFSFDSATDRMFAPDLAMRFAAYGMKLPRGTSLASFIASYQAPNIARGGTACHPPPDQWERILVDGHDAGLVVGCDYIEVMLVVDGRVYILSGYDNLATDRRLFDAILSTVRLDPASAAEPPVVASPSPSRAAR